MKRLDNQSGRAIDYSADIAQLERFYQKQYELIKAGNTDLATFELVMLGNALDFIQMVRVSFGVELDGQEKSINAFEEVLDAFKRGIANKNVFDIAESKIAEKAASYFGFLITANSGGEWLDTPDGAVVSIQGRDAYVYAFIRQYLSGNADISAVQYYRNTKMIK